MNLQTLKTLAELRGLNQSDLAKMAGVRRQAVSLWFKGTEPGGDIHLKAQHLYRLAKTLGVSLEVLREPLPMLSEPKEVASLETSLLWDRLYPSLARFSVALLRCESPAIARLVQVYGLFQAAAIAGNRVWTKFPVYKRFIEAVQRKEWERVWKLQKNLGLI
ncbi:MAG TPA: helix-turn-helix transcriptional regulator [Bdellovibrionota bacterium]|nr:helix-turn-helix transcriptional regulator [Bdellovibrionota bacterium]